MAYQLANIPIRSSDFYAHSPSIRFTVCSLLRIYSPTPFAHYLACFQSPSFRVATGLEPVLPPMAGVYPIKPIQHHLCSFATPCISLLKGNRWSVYSIHDFKHSVFRSDNTCIGLAVWYGWLSLLIHPVKRIRATTGVEPVSRPPSRVVFSQLNYVATLLPNRLLVSSLSKGTPPRPFARPFNARIPTKCFFWKEFNRAIGFEPISAPPKGAVLNH